VVRSPQRALHALVLKIEKKGKEVKKLRTFLRTEEWAEVEQYHGSVRVGFGGSDAVVFDIVQDGDGCGKIKALISAGSLDAYMAEESLDAVEVTAVLTEEFIKDSNGGHYKLSFEFGPSGVSPFISRDIQLLLNGVTGKWSVKSTQFWVYDEAGKRSLAPATMRPA